MGSRILRGRGITSRDNAGAVAVAVVDEEFAARNWPGNNAVGQQIKLVDLEPNGPWYTIVGVASHALEISPTARLVGQGRIRGTHLIYRSLAQVAPSWPANSAPAVPAFGFVVRGADGEQLVPAVRSALQPVLADQPLDFLGTLQEYYNADGLAARRKALLLGVTAVFGIALAVIGIVALVVDAVRRRTREIGIRVTLGASAGHLVGMIVREIALVSSIGVAAGLIASALVGRLVGHYLFGLGGGFDDARVVAGAVFGVLAVAIASATLPAHRVLRIDPTNALRTD
jgi:hypothetical protein